MNLLKIKHSFYKFKGYRVICKSKNKPKFRFLNALEQCVELYNEDYLYLVIRCDKEECYGWRIKKCTILEELCVEKYDKNTLLYQLDFFVM